MSYPNSSRAWLLRSVRVRLPRPLLYLCFASLIVVACGPDSSDKPDAQPVVPDADGDRISDDDESCATSLDTDGDGTPNCADSDSDNDGIPDSLEAGDGDLLTPPIDSDSDGEPDYLDLDADGNGLPDASEGTNDLDNDGIPDSSDLDNDGDAIMDTLEIGVNPGMPMDFDNDGIPDMWDRDSDDDLILDVHDRADDPDGDLLLSFRDTDSDNDCLSDTIESGDNDRETAPIDTDLDTRPDFKDLDRDDDGLADSSEDSNCNGVVDDNETDASDADSDDDGANDLVEVAAGTDPDSSLDNPQNNGDFVFIVPYQDTPTPTEDQLDFSTKLQKVDVFTLVDRSGSMTDEILAIRSQIQSVADAVTCFPLGMGNEDDCVPDIWWGAGTVGYRGTNGQPYIKHLDLQPNPALITGAIFSTEPPGGFDEPLHLGVYSTITGSGSTADEHMCTVNSTYGPRTNCADSPAANAGEGGSGYPCFRDDALSLIVLVTDEAPSGTYNCPTQEAVAATANAANVKVIGVVGSAPMAVTDDLAALAAATGAVDASSNDAPLVVDGSDDNAATALATAIRKMAAGIPLDVSVTAEDDAGDGVDAVTAFIDRLDPLQLGNEMCASGLTEIDINNDGYLDYENVQARTPVCWTLVPKINTTVMPISDPQLYTATIRVRGDETTVLDTRNVFFLVPPAIPQLE